MGRNAAFLKTPWQNYSTNETRSLDNCTSRRKVSMTHCYIPGFSDSQVMGSHRVMRFLLQVATRVGYQGYREGMDV